MLVNKFVYFLKFDDDEKHREPKCSNNITLKVSCLGKFNFLMVKMIKFGLFAVLKVDIHIYLSYPQNPTNSCVSVRYYYLCVFVSVK